MNPTNTKYPAVWHERIQSKSNEVEILRLDLIDEVRSALETLQNKYQWDDAYIFGSLAKKGKFRVNSDIDIAVSGLNKFEHYAFIGAISELLNRKVDVIRFEDCKFSHSIVDRGIRCKPKHKS